MYLNAPVDIKTILLVVEGLFGIGTVAILVICHNKSRHEKFKQWLKLGTYFIIVHTVILSAFSKTWFTGLVLLIGVVGACEIVVVSKFKDKNIFPNLMFIVGYLCCISLLVLFARKETVNFILFVYVSVAVCDAFSQITGQLFGSHKLAPKISPSKTIEGVVGGFVGSLCIAIFFHGMIHVSIGIACIFGAVIAISSVSGDLVSSWFKRQNRVKDYSALLPGQGGVLDRFNSFIVAAPIVMVVKSMLH